MFAFDRNPGIKRTLAVPTNPMRYEPVRPSLAEQDARRAFSAVRTAAACRQVERPMAVSFGGRKARSNRGAPSSSSSDFICIDNADNVMFRLISAFAKEPTLEISMSVTSDLVCISSKYLYLISSLIRLQ